MFIVTLFNAGPHPLTGFPLHPAQHDKIAATPNLCHREKQKLLENGPRFPYRRAFNYLSLGNISLTFRTQIYVKNDSIHWHSGFSNCSFQLRELLRSALPGFWIGRWGIHGKL